MYAAELDCYGAESGWTRLRRFPQVARCARGRTINAATKGRVHFSLLSVALVPGWVFELQNEDRRAAQVSWLETVHPARRTKVGHTNYILPKASSRFSTPSVKQLVRRQLRNAANRFFLLKVGIKYIGRWVSFREQRSRGNQPPPSDDRGFVSWSCVVFAGYGGVTGTLLCSAWT